MGIYTGDSISNLTRIAHQDDRYLPGHYARAKFDAQDGKIYKIAVDGALDDSGFVTLAVTPSSRAILSASFDEEAVNVMVAAEAGYSFRLDASTNLAQWEPLGTWLNTNGTLRFTDPKAASSKRRFFRAYALP